MKNQMIVTNIRIPEIEYLEVKEAATEGGISVNQFIRQALVSTVTGRTLGVKRKRRSKKVEKKSIWTELAKIARLPNKPMGELSEEDKVIYGE